MAFDASTAEPVAAQSGFDPATAQPVPVSEKSEASPFAINEAEFKAASPLGRLKLMLEHPWDKYVASVDQAFQGPIKPTRLEADPGVANLPAQVGAASINLAQGVGTGAVSPGTAAAVVSPASILYSVPRFVVGGVEDIYDAVKGAIEGKSGVQETLEKGVGGVVQAAGGVAAGVHGLHSDVTPKTPTEAVDILKAEAAKTADPQVRAALDAAAEKISSKAAEGVKFDASTSEPVETNSTPKVFDETTATPIQEEPKTTTDFSGADEPDTHGIAARVSEARAQAGHIESIEPGEGISTEETIAKGREALKDGKDPQDALDEFTTTGKISADDVGLVRAHGEALAKAASDAAEAHGIDSPEYRAAAAADSEWTKAIKPMQTEWHKIGMAQQGETEIDTGTYHGLRRAFQDATGGDFTPSQSETAIKIADSVKQAVAEADAAKQTLFDFFKDVPRSLPDATAQRMWDLAKDYIDNGESDFDNLRNKVAADTGKTVDEVTKILAEPKGARAITNEMYSKMAARRQMVETAKSWLREQAMPGWLRAARTLPSAFFKLATFGHGTVGMVTHAGFNIFDPVVQKVYWPNFFRQFKLLGWHDQGAYHERMMQDLTRDPNYVTARRGGLANDPARYLDDYQSGWLTGYFHRIGLVGNRGFDALKLYRQDRFNQIWDSYPKSLRTADNAKLVSDSVNHATGVVKSRFGEWANWTFFAPKLEGSRWAWMIGDPLKATKILSDWKNATPGEQEFAMREVRQKAMVTGTYLGLLAINQGLLSASGSKQQINLTNPERSDFLAFKAGNHNFGIIAPMLGLVRLFANLLHVSVGTRTKFEQQTSRAEQMGNTAVQYARGKLSPFAGVAADVATQSDYAKRPLPFSSDKVPRYLRRQGEEKYTYGEYAAEHLTPIPIEEAVREVWRKQGMAESDIDHWMKALASAALMGGTGARMTPDTHIGQPVNPKR